MAIKIKPSHEGLFKRKALAQGLNVASYANQVLAKNSKASGATKKQANFARNAAKWKH